MIKAVGLTKIFDGKRALDAIDLSINDGSIYGLVGSNGSGKSTFLRLAAGIYMPDSGEITADGEKIFDNFRKKTEIAYLGDTPYFMPHATIKETAKLYHTVYPNFDNALYNRLLEIFPLDYKARIATMSKGMQEKMQLLLVMSREAKLYILDEPLGGVDPVARDFIMETIMKNHLANSTILLSTHLIYDIEGILDRVLMVKGGSLAVNTDVKTISEHNMTVEDLFKEVFRNVM